MNNLSWKAVVVSGILLMGIGAAWIGRYELVAAQPGAGPGDVYLLDRWTGHVKFLRNGDIDDVTSRAEGAVR